MPIYKLFLLSFYLVTTTVKAENGFSFKPTPLTPSIYMLEGTGGSVTVLIGKDGTLLVDDGFAPMANKLLNQLQELGGEFPRFVINTHFHYDHSGGNEFFAPRATIIAAETVLHRLMTEQTLWKKQHPPVPTHALPQLTFEKFLTLHLNGEEILIQHLPKGHTDGDTIVLFKKSKVASLGDLYFAGMYPIFHPEHQGSLDGYIKSIEWAIKHIPEDYKIIPGHGPLSNKAELMRYHQMILASVLAVKKGIQNKKTLEQIQKKGLPPEWESFSHGYATTDRWLAMIYNSLRSLR